MRLHASCNAWQCAAALCAAIAAAVVPVGIDAHKGITSPYTYNEHVFPILRARCGRCHVDGGPTPMSLMTYKDAMPWAASMREQLVSEAMPPWYADPECPALKRGHLITAKELDILMTWATGGAPEGDPAKASPPFQIPSGWQGGEPDLTLPLETQVLRAGETEATRTFTVASGLAEEKWIKSVDLLPGTPSMVREAVVTVDGGKILGTWVPGEPPIEPPSGAAFRLPAGSRLSVTLRLKKHWQDEQAEKSDSSTLGLYFTDAPVSGRGIEAIVVEVPASETGASGSTPFSRALATPARVIAVRPRISRPYGAIAVDAVLSNGRRMALLHLRAPRPGWGRHYWLADPIELPKGARIEVSAILPGNGSPDPIDSPPLQIGIDFVPL